MKTYSLLFACLFSTAISHAANIGWVSFHDTDAPTTNAAAAGFTFAPDKPYTDLLRNAGHTVTRVLTQNEMGGIAGAANLLNSFDLVIIGRSIDSTHYGSDPESAFWNSTITAPTILTSGYILRGGDATVANDRLGYTTGSTMVDTSGNVTLTVANPSHVIFAGTTLGAGNTLNYAVGVTGPTNSLQRGISVNTNPAFTGGTVLATTATGGMVIGEWNAGTPMNTAITTGPQDVLGGHRLVLLTGTREQSGGNSQTAGMYDLTADGAQVFLNAVNYMAVPEPSTYALLTASALAIAFTTRRRRYNSPAPSPNRD